MPGPGAKPKNFKKTLSQLMQYCKVFLPMIIIALVLAMAGAIFNIVGPELLSEITDLITEGLMTNVDIDAVVNVAANRASAASLGEAP